jgi:DNA-directed RNA polymerase beta subunit
MLKFFYPLKKVMFEPIMQRNSFTYFLKKGLIEELRRVEKIASAHLEVNFQVNRLKYKKPLLSPEVCLQKNLTYTIDLYVPITIKFKRFILLK